MTQIEPYFLNSSTVFVDNSPTKIYTVVGSCVSVCLYDPVLKYGGMNHYILPIWSGEGLSSSKYGNVAMEKLIEKMLAMGSRKQNLIAKVFGGAKEIEDPSLFNIGKRNIRIAEEVLGDYSIPIKAMNVDGAVGRKIIFYSHTGLVFMKFI
jgi:chemotaxis protein CheD